MALMRCPECKAEVSVSAKSCPKCGHPLKKGRGKTVGIAFGVGAIALTAGACLVYLLGVLEFAGVGEEERRSDRETGELRLAESGEQGDAVKPWAPIKTPEPQVGDMKVIHLDGGVDLELMWIPPGTFMMGSRDSASLVGSKLDIEAEWYEDEHPQHQVTLSKGFWMGRYEVTQAQWKTVTGTSPSPLEGNDLPVDAVSWDDCQEFIKKLNAEVDALGFKTTVPCSEGGDMPLPDGTYVSLLEIQNQEDQLRSLYRALVDAMRKLEITGKYFIGMANAPISNICGKL